MTRKYVSPQIKVIDITLSGCLAQSGGGIPKDKDNLDPGFFQTNSNSFDCLFEVKMDEE